MIEVTDIGLILEIGIHRHRKDGLSEARRLIEAKHALTVFDTRKSDGQAGAMGAQAALSPRTFATARETVVASLPSLQASFESQRRQWRD